MSKRVFDQIDRNLHSASLQYSKKNYKKALGFAEKACKMAQDKQVFEYLGDCLYVKGELQEALGKKSDALDTYQDGFTILYERFLVDSTNTKIQSGLEKCLGAMVSALHDIGDIILIQDICEMYEKDFDKILDIYSGLKKDFLVQIHYGQTFYAVMALYIMGRKAREHKDLALEMIDVFEKQLESEPEDSSPIEKAYDITKEYVQECISINAIDEAIEVLLKAQAFLNKNVSEFGEIVVYQIQIEEFLTMCYGLKGEDACIEEHSNRSSEMIDDLFEDVPGNPSLVLLKARKFENLGMVFLEEDNFEKAGPCYEQALENAESIFELDVSYREHVEEFIDLFEDMSEAFDILDMPEKRVSCYLDQVRILEFSLDNDPDDPVECKLDIASCFSDTAKALLEMNKPGQATNYYEQEIAVYRQLLEADPGNVDYRAYIAGALNSLGFAHLDMGKKAAGQYFTGGLKLYEEIFELTGADDAAGYCDLLRGLARVKMSGEEYEEALSLFQKAIDLLEVKLNSTSKNTALQIDLAMIYTNAAEIYYEMADLKKAEEFIMKNMDVNSSLRDEMDGMPGFRPLVIGMLFNEGMNNSLMRKYGLAALYLTIALDRCEEEIAKGDLSAELLSPCVAVVEQLCRVLFAQKHYEKVIQMRERLVFILETSEPVCFNEPYDLENMSTAYSLIGLCYSAAGELKLSQEAFETSLRIREGIWEEFPDHEIELSDEIACLEGYRDVLKRQGLKDKFSHYARVLDKKKKELKEMESRW